MCSGPDTSGSPRSGVVGVFTVGAWVALDPLPELPLLPLLPVVSVPVEPPPEPPAPPPLRAGAEPLAPVCLLASATTARFSLVGPVWKVASPRDAWLLLAAHFTAADIDRYRAAIIDVFWFCFKVGVAVYVLIWVRGTFPRFRYDQLMNIGWKVMIPTALGAILVNALIGMAKS